MKSAEEWYKSELSGLSDRSLVELVRAIQLDAFRAGLTKCRDAIESLLLKDMDFDGYVKRFGFGPEHAEQNACEALDATK